MKYILYILFFAIQIHSKAQYLENPFIEFNGLERYSLDDRYYRYSVLNEDPMHFFNSKKYNSAYHSSISLTLPLTPSPSPVQEFGYAVLKIGMSLITSGRYNVGYDNSRYRYTPPMYKD